MKKLIKKLAKLERKYENTPEKCKVKRERILRAYENTYKKFKFLYGKDES